MVFNVLLARRMTILPSRSEMSRENERKRRAKVRVIILFVAKKASTSKVFWNRKKFTCKMGYMSKIRRHLCTLSHLFDNYFVLWFVLCWVVRLNSRGSTKIYDNLKPTPGSP